jgi:putative transposase
VVSALSVRPKKPSSPTRKMFLSSQVKELVALDFFVVPTVTYKVLFVLLMLSHHRRRVAHVKVTAHPTAEWTAQPLVEEFPWDAAL